MANRGTKKSKPSKETPWAGEKFKDNAAKKLSKVKDYISINRGTEKVSTKDIKKSKSKSLKGRKVSTGRGTGSRIL